MKLYKIISKIERRIWLHKPILSYLCRMKIKFTDNGEIIDVEDFPALVNYMNRSSHTPAINDDFYMREYARRAVISSNEDIRATSVQEFVEDLIQLGHIQILDAIHPN